MKMTAELKKWLIENCDCKEDAGDDELRKAAGTALATGDLTAEKYIELTKEPEEDEANEFDRKLDGIADGLQKLVEVMTPKKDEKKTETKDEAKTEAEDEKKAGTKDVKPSRLAKMIAALGGTPTEDPDGKGIDVRVKEAVEQYSTTKSALKYPAETKNGKPHSMAGERVKEFGRSLDEASEKDTALAGVWAKFQLLSVTKKIAGNAPDAWKLLTEHEKSLLAHLCENETWDYSEDGKLAHRRGYPGANGRGGGGVKQLIDDGGPSGALEAAPIVFDDQVIQAPLLHGELYPLVHTITLDRGRRVEGVATGTVTGAWGGVDDTAIALFNTNAYVTAFDTTIYRWQGAIRIGLDFLSDTPIDFGAHITKQYGERLLEDLDDVIAVGNGTTQPEGVVTNGGTAVAWGGATTIGNYESLRFAVPKREHRANLVASAVFCGTETSYMRAKALPLGTADARRLFAGGSTNVGTYDDYAMMNRKYKINESLANTQIFYAILALYRMYRRKGLTVRTSTEGDTLIRRNEMLITLMARYGGQVERAAIAGVTTTAPA
jgi:HK97 family phage major capsid protein